MISLIVIDYNLNIVLRGTLEKISLHRTILIIETKMDRPNREACDSNHPRPEDDDDVVERAPPKKRSRLSKSRVYKSLYEDSENITVKKYKPSSPIQVVKISQFHLQGTFHTYVEKNKRLFDIVRNCPVYIFSDRDVMKQFFFLHENKILQPQILILNVRQFSRDWNHAFFVSIFSKLEKLNDSPIKCILLVCDNELAHKRATNIIKSLCNRLKESIYSVEEKDINIFSTLTQTMMKISSKEAKKLRGVINSHHAGMLAQNIGPMPEVQATDEVQRQSKDDDSDENVVVGGQGAQLAIYKALYFEDTNLILQKFEPQSSIQVVYLCAFKLLKDLKIYIENNKLLFPVISECPVFTFASYNTLLHLAFLLYKKKLLQPRVLILNLRFFETEWRYNHPGFLRKIVKILDGRYKKGEIHPVSIETLLLVGDSEKVKQRVAHVIRNRCNNFKGDIFTISKDHINTVFTVTKSKMDISEKEINDLRKKISAHDTSTQIASSSTSNIMIEHHRQLSSEGSDTEDELLSKSDDAHKPSSSEEPSDMVCESLSESDKASQNIETGGSVYSIIETIKSGIFHSRTILKDIVDEQASDMDCEPIPSSSSRGFFGTSINPGRPEKMQANGSFVELPFTSNPFK
jgi:hypothetical protein